MAKYRVYLHDGKGIFNVEATSFNVKAADGIIDFYDKTEWVATFAVTLVYAIVRTDKVFDVAMDTMIRMGADDANRMLKQEETFTPPKDEKQMAAWVDMCGEKVALIDCLVRVDDYRYDVECIKRELAALRGEVELMQSN